MAAAGWRRGGSEAPSSPLAYPVPLAAAIAALWSAVVPAFVLMLVFVVGWVFSADAGADAASALVAALGLWLLAHAVPLGAGGLQLGLTPLLLTLLILWSSRRFVHWAIRNSIVHSRAGALSLLGSYAAAYAAAGLGISLVASGGVQTNASLVLVTTFVWGLLGAGWGLRSGIDLTGPTAPLGYAAAGSSEASRLQEQAPGRLLADDFGLLPQLARDAIAAALRVGLWLALLGTLAAAAVIATRIGEFTSILTAVTDSALGVAELLLLNLLYLPTLVIWTASVLAGGTLTVGAGTAVTLTGVSLGPLPAIPLLALLPPALPAWAPALWPLSAVAVWLGVRPLVRKVAASSSVDQLAVGLLLTLAASALSMLAAKLAGGALGIGRFTEVGPVVWQVGAAVCLLTGGAYALPLVLRRLRQR